MNKITIIKFSESTFQQMENEWESCLAASESNLLFSSWKWQVTWWEVWKPRLNVELTLLGVFESNKLIGLVPLYSYYYKKFKLVSIKRCEFIGNHEIGNDSVRSEYLDFIIPSGRNKELLPYIFTFLKKEGIDELLLKDMPNASHTVEYISDNLSVIQKGKDIGIKLETKSELSEYLLTLGKNTRLKMFNRRSMLEELQIEQCKEESELGEFFDYLNTFHLPRWGQKCFSAHSLNFHQQVASYYLNKGDLNATLLKNGSEVVAVSYDICRGKTRYNIQLGFSEYMSNKVSFGTLMLGYSVEGAFIDPDIEYYDFLAGSGKSTFYKDKFKGNQQVFCTLNIPLTAKVRGLFIFDNMLRTIKRRFLVLFRQI